MGKIKLLDKSVANLIAAGEVVERPASVVKELLENSIDAGAKHITTEIKNGGIKFIRVMDDGSGMGKEDVKNSLIRHATSKIEKADDLDAIMTLGFRGEALASIAAVADVEIYTKTENEEIGAHLLSKAGGEACVTDAGCPKGTTILVRDLFSTAPARMKFLKKDYTEAGYIADIINRLALGMPDISFKLINNDKEQLFTTGDGNLSGAVRAVYGKDIEKAMVPCDFSENGVRAYGLCAKAEGARANRSMQSFFINGRYIKSALLTRAVEEAYKNELMGGKFPSCVINIEIKPQMVDINVHPTKLEAKFANESDVYHAVYWAVKNALYEKKTIPEVKQAPKPKFGLDMPKAEPISLGGIAPNVKREEEKPKQITMRETDFAQKSAQLPKKAPQDPLFKELLKTPVFDFEIEKKQTEEIKKAEVKKEEIKTAEEIKENLPQKEIIKEEIFEEIKDAEIKTQEKIATKEEKAEEPAPYKICGQIFNTYIIVERDGEMLLVDQHAAHERLRYEKLLREYEERKITQQTFLMPHIFDLAASEFASFTEYKKEISDLGFEADAFGERSVRISAVPQDAADGDIQSLFLEVLKSLSQNKKSNMTEKMRSTIYQISCKGAIKANMKLSEPEMKTLLNNVFALSGINTCPHGRPITISFTKYFIEKQFKRIV